MLAILLAFIALFSWGTADIFGGLVSRKINGHSVAIWIFTINSLLATLMLPFVHINLTRTTVDSALTMLGLAIIGTLPFMMLYEAIRRGNASIAGTIAAAYSAVSIILAVLFLHAEINMTITIFIVLIFVGIVLVSINFSSTSLKTVLKDKGVPYALAACILWGIYYAFIKLPVSNYGWFLPAYITWLTFPLGILFMRIKQIPLIKSPTLKLLVFQIFNAIMIMLGIFAFNYAIALSSVPIVIGISSGYPLLFVILAAIVFKDKIDKQQMLGLIMGLIGIIGLGFLAKLI